MIALNIPDDNIQFIKHIFETRLVTNKEIRTQLKQTLQRLELGPMTRFHATCEKILVGFGFELLSVDELKIIETLLHNITEIFTQRAIEEGQQ